MRIENLHLIKLSFLTALSAVSIALNSPLSPEQLNEIEANSSQSAENSKPENNYDCPTCGMG